MRWYPLVPDAVVGLGSIGESLVIHGRPASSDVQGACFRIYVAALEGAHLAYAQSVPEHGQVDAHTVAFRHGIIDGLDLFRRGRDCL